MKRTELWAENWAWLGVAAIGAHTQCLGCTQAWGETGVFCTGIPELWK